jgi:hypothetical protein
MVKRARKDADGDAIPGLGVDAFGGQTVDPTQNVKDLMNASIKSIAEKADLQARLAEVNHLHLKEIGALRERYQDTVGTLREAHQGKMQQAEAGRLDSIRQVDREEVAKTAITANTAIATLAKQTTDLATTLQSRVDATANAAEARSSSQYNDITKRLQAVELSLSEGKGKQQVSDPAFDKLNTLVERLVSSQATTGGQKQGMSDAMKLIITLISVAGTLILIGGAFVTLILFLNRVPVR